MSSNQLEEILKKINSKKVQLQDDAEAKNNKILQQVLDAVVAELRSDRVFNSLFREVKYGGSYYEGLKVSNPDEYDILFVLNMPKLTYLPTTTVDAGYVKIRFETLSFDRDLSTFLDQNGYMSVNKTNSWFQGLLDKAMPNLKRKLNVSLKYSSSGPARTLIVGNSFSIDLVPCFEMLKQWWPNDYTQSALNKGYFIIPKPIDNQPLYWRCSFYEHELTILHGLEKVKGAIRLLKVLRDEQQLTELKSYFIKTVFLLENPQNLARYKEMSLSQVFLLMLKKLEEYVRSQQIPYFWNKNMNLIKRNPNLWVNIANSLRGIHQQISNNPYNANNYFKV